MILLAVLQRCQYAAGIKYKQYNNPYSVSFSETAEDTYLRRAERHHAYLVTDPLQQDALRDKEAWRWSICRCVPRYPKVDS